MEDFAELAPIDGGWSGETFLGRVGESPVVVRLYAGRSAARGPDAVDVDAALLRLLRGIVPVPQVLEVRRPSGELPALLVTEHLSGTPAAALLPHLDRRDRARLGDRLGAVLDRLAHVPTPRAGVFRGPDLRIEPFAVDAVPGWVAAQLPALTTWEQPARHRLERLADLAQDLLDTVPRTSVAHSDFNPKNLLVDPETLAVTGVVDWEFAHSGSPYTDVGNLLRFDRDPDLVAAVLARWGDLDLARAADLTALVDLAARDHDPASRNPVTREAHRLLRAIVASGDLHAVP
ncbi:MAG: phosphotransferase [Nocardioides sp.]